ncbi:hypothetical protein [Streptobacillus canis]|uniref:hypothetical protein n=1 Tax=Streptobacillus canis TaxID=2678686 RepID=UPI0012E2ECDF|nr:hypothetical protein [Streptobacillus canis]
MKKMRALVQLEYIERIANDLESFEIKKNTLANIWIKYYSDKELSRIEKNKKDKKMFQFNLWKENEENYFEILTKHKENSDAEYIRNLINTYFINPKYKREQIIFYDEVEKINKAIERKKKLEIEFSGEKIHVTPYAIKVDRSENFNIVFLYNEEKEKYMFIELKKMKNIVILDIAGIYKDKAFIKKNSEIFFYEEQFEGINLQTRLPIEGIEKATSNVVDGIKSDKINTKLEIEFFPKYNIKKEDYFYTFLDKKREEVI